MGYIVIARRLSAVFVLGLCASLFAGCDNSTGTPPELSEAEIQQRQANEADARARAYGKGGAPTGKSAGRAAKASKAGDPAKAAEPTDAAEPDAEAAEKPAP